MRSVFALMFLMVCNSAFAQFGGLQQMAMTLRADAINLYDDISTAKNNFNPNLGDYEGVNKIIQDSTTHTAEQKAQANTLTDAIGADFLRMMTSLGNMIRLMADARVLIFEGDQRMSGLNFIGAMSKYQDSKTLLYEAIQHYADACIWKNAALVKLAMLTEIAIN